MTKQKDIVSTYKEVDLLIYLFRLFGVFQEERAFAKLDASAASQQKRAAVWVDWELGDEATPPAMPGVRQLSMGDQMYERMGSLLSRMPEQQRSDVLSLYADDRAAAERARVLVTCCALVDANLATQVRRLEGELEDFRRRELWDDARMVVARLHRHDLVRGNVEWTRWHSAGITGKPSENDRQVIDILRGKGGFLDPLWQKALVDVGFGEENS